jgi:hypothetical protein
MKTYREILDEMTVAGTGVGAYSPPLSMNKKFSAKNSMLMQFDQCVNSMHRKDMLHQCRTLGLSQGKMTDEELRKSLLGMSVRNKRKFMGA